MPPIQNAEIQKVNQFWSQVRKNKWPLAALLFLCTSLAVYFWKEYQIQQTKETIIYRASEQLTLSNRHMLKTFVKPLVWTVRAEMLRNNLEGVSILTNDLVTDRQLKLISLIDTEGKIIISSNKGYESKPSTDLYPAYLLLTDSIVILPKSNNVWILSSPVMGYDKRIGTLIIDYTPSLFTWPMEIGK